MYVYIVCERGERVRERKIRKEGERMHIIQFGVFLIDTASLII